MYKKYLALSALAAVQANSDHWAVLVTGSKGFMNYRHQADTCHAYKLLKDNGIPEDQIILMSADDAAYSRSNPFPGQLYNKPTAAEAGFDVYNGCKMAYKGRDVTPANLLNVLVGNASEVNGPVLKSNANSKVFFYFADHGAPGLVAMPYGGYLYADQFNQALKTMHDKKMFKEMTVYMEACESGSMFENHLKDNLNIYATSAANSHESSWGTYCHPNDVVGGKSIGSCLGDLYSVNWMEDSDRGKMSSETLQDQYKIVKSKTTKSHVLQWGDVSFTKEPIGNFESGADALVKKQKWWKELKHVGKQFLKDVTEWDKWTAVEQNDSAVDARDITLHYMYAKVQEDPTEENMENLMKELAKRTQIEKEFQAMFPRHIEAVGNKTVPLPTDFACYRKLVNTYTEACGEADEYALKFFHYFVAECEGLKSAPEKIVESVESVKTVCQARVTPIEATN